VEVTSGLPDRVESLGPDPLAIDGERFVGLVRSHRGRIKPLLLNQRFLRGLGNIYVDESLFAAGIHPLAVAARLPRQRLHRLHECIQQTLQSAIEHGGSSISDYVNSEGRRGGFQDLHAVYGREDLPCLVCGTPVRRIVVAQRGTHLCPKCQKR
jgi:formamidopyrimidine-DNA glycosylase